MTLCIYRVGKGSNWCYFQEHIRKISELSRQSPHELADLNLREDSKMIDCDDKLLTVAIKNSFEKRSTQCQQRRHQEPHSSS